jgi:TM2 domain-containing membrane protein YozV
LGLLLNVVDQFLTVEYYSDIFSSYAYSADEKMQAVAFLALSLVSLALFATAALLVVLKKYLIAPIFTIAAALMSTFGEMVIWGNWELPGFYFLTHIAGLDFSYEGIGTYLFRQFLKFFFYGLIAISIVTLVSQNAKTKPKQSDLWPAAPMAAPASPESATQIVSAANVAAAPTAQRGNTNMSAQWEVMIPGASDPQVDTATLQVWAMAGRLKPNTLVKEISTGVTYTAAQIPGVFSEKQFVTALILSILLGSLGIDRFYTGHVGLGVGKLLTLGGCGIWAIIDIILYATRKVNDSDGRPLQ